MKTTWVTYQRLWMQFVKNEYSWRSKEVMYHPLVGEPNFGKKIDVFQ